MIILGLGTYFPPINVLSNQKHDMYHGIRKPCKLKVRGYVEHMSEVNKYLAILRWSNTSDKVRDTELKNYTTQHVKKVQWSDICTGI